MTKLLERLQIVEGVPPVDLQTGANDGDWVSLKNYRRVIVMFHSGIGTNGEDPILTMEQATDNAGAGAKALTFATIYRKQAATNLAAVAQWTKTTQVAAATYTNTDAAEQSALWLVEFEAGDLDVDGGFDHIRARVADVGGAGAQPGSLHYILGDAVHERAPENMLSAL